MWKVSFLHLITRDKESGRKICINKACYFFTSLPHAQTLFRFFTNWAFDNYQSRLWFFQWSCMDVRAGLWRKLSAEELMLLKCGVGEDSWESLGLQGNPTSPFWRRPALGFLWKDWYWGWNSSTLATSWAELTHWKRLWCWEGLGAGGEGDDRRWDGWLVSLTWWTWVWVNSGSWWLIGRPGVLRFMGLQWVGYDWVTELNEKYKTACFGHFLGTLSMRTLYAQIKIYFFFFSC